MSSEAHSFDEDLIPLNNDNKKTFLILSVLLLGGSGTQETTMSVGAPGQGHIQRKSVQLAGAAPACGLDPLVSFPLQPCPGFRS